MWLPPTSANRRTDHVFILERWHPVTYVLRCVFILHSALCKLHVVPGFIRSMSYSAACCDLKGSQQAVQAAWASYGWWLCRRLRAVASGSFSNVLHCSCHHPRVFGAERGFSCGIYAKPGLLVSHVTLEYKMQEKNQQCCCCFFDHRPLLRSLVLPLKLTLSSQTPQSTIAPKISAFFFFFFFAKNTRNSDFREQSSISRSAAHPFDVKREYYLVPKYNLHPPCSRGSVSI